MRAFKNLFQLCIFKPLKVAFLCTQNPLVVAFNASFYLFTVNLIFLQTSLFISSRLLHEKCISDSFRTERAVDSFEGEAHVLAYDPAGCAQKVALVLLAGVTGSTA